METIDLARAKALVKAAVERTPNRKNPRFDGSGLCLYTSEHRSDVHCIAGQVITDAGGKCPGPDVQIGFKSLIEREDVDFDVCLNFTDDAVSYLASVQNVFDGCNWVYHPVTEKEITLPRVEAGNSRRWASALNLVEKHFG